MDYAKWKHIFDQNAATRKASGSQKEHLFRDADKPNEIIILFEWDDLGKARSFDQSDDLAKTMLTAGVSDKSDICFL